MSTSPPPVPPYCATKHAVVGLSEAVRLELRGTPIELSVVMPAIVNTELTSGVARTRGVRVAEPAAAAGRAPARRDESGAAGRHHRQRRILKEVRRGVPRPPAEVIGVAMRR